jgi:hypothetical protein
MDFRTSDSVPDNLHLTSAQRHQASHFEPVLTPGTLHLGCLGHEVSDAIRPFEHDVGFIRRLIDRLSGDAASELRSRHDARQLLRRIELDQRPPVVPETLLQVPRKLHELQADGQWRGAIQGRDRNGFR